MNEKQRYDHIDIARGIAIILVVVGHSCHTPENPLNRLILSFHMPLFFFLSGIFAKECSIPDIMRKIGPKAKRLLIPQITLGFATIILSLVKFVMKGEEINIGLNVFWGWFLPVLFLCSVLFMFLSSVLDMQSTRNKIMITLVLLGGAILCSVSNLHEPQFWEDWLIKTPIAFFFYFVGFITRNYSLRQIKENKISNDSILIIMASILFVLSQWNSPVFMYINEYGNFILFIITSFLGAYVIIELSKRVMHFQLIIEIGKLTIAIYIWNFLIIAVVKSLIHKFLLDTGLYTGAVQAALAFVISMSILYLFSKFTNKYFPLIYGSK